MQNSLEKYVNFLEDYARFLKKGNKPVIDIPLTPEELLAEAKRVKAKSRLRAENRSIIMLLADREGEHWANLEGEVVIVFDKLYRPLRVEIEVKDMMGSDKVLSDAGLLSTLEEAH